VEPAETDGDGAVLQGTVAYVTGASSAIGRVAIEVLLEQEARVVAVGRDARRLAAVASVDQSKVRAVTADVGDEKVWPAIVEAGAAWGPPGALVTVAGVAHRGPFAESRASHWDEMWRTNVKGTLLAARAVMPAMAERGFGRVVVISSVVARVGARDRVAYSASKGAVESAARSLAVEFAATGVTVNTIAPGAMPTEGSQRWLDANPELSRATLEAIPERRYGAANDLRAAFRYLITSSYAQGSTVTVDGGWSAV
jgi:NAD(P)-dependent dehydrogenase (short-subunit alcohol dehydrogenase family)